MAGTLTVGGGGNLIGTVLSFYLGNKRLAQQKELDEARELGINQRAGLALDAGNNARLLEFGMSTLGPDTSIHSPQAVQLLGPPLLEMGLDINTLPEGTTVNQLSAMEALNERLGETGQIVLDGLTSEQIQAAGLGTIAALSGGRTPSEVQATEILTRIDIEAAENLFGEAVDPKLRNQRLYAHSLAMFGLDEPVSIGGQTFLTNDAASLAIANMNLGLARQRLGLAREVAGQRITEFNYTVSVANINSVKAAGIPHGYAWTNGQIRGILASNTLGEIADEAKSTEKLEPNDALGRSNRAMAQAITLGGLSEAGKFVQLIEELGPAAQAIALEMDALANATDVSPSERDAKAEGWLKALRIIAVQQGKEHLVPLITPTPWWHSIANYLEIPIGDRGATFSELLDGPGGASPGVSSSPTSGLEGEEGPTSRESELAAAVQRILTSRSTLEIEATNLHLTLNEKEALARMTAPVGTP